MAKLVAFFLILATSLVSALLCGQREYYDYPSDSCLPCFDHCNNCDSGHTCFECDAYWYLDEWDLQCYECIPGCELCFGPYGWDCFACEDPNNMVVADECVPCDVCEDGVTYAYQQCNAFWNRVCYPCDTCPNGKYESVPCNVDYNIQCEDCSTSCPSGTYEHAACTPAHDLDCRSCSTGCTTCTGPNGNQCSVCQSGYYLTAGVGCSVCSTCGAGYYQTAACSATTNTVCAACSGTCPGGQYQSSACGGTSDRVCSTCSTCGTGQWQVTACDSLANTVCQACTVCGSGFYQTTACGATTDTVCTACLANCHSCTGTDFASCSACKSGFFLDNVHSTCTACVDNCATCTDTTFSTCSLCKPGFFLDAVSSTCKACTPCASGKYETTACDGVVDRVCTGDCLANCKTCTGPDFADCSQCVHGYGLQTSSSTCAACAVAPCPNSLHRPWDRCYDNYVSTCQHCVLPLVQFCGAGGNPPAQWITDAVGNVVRAGCCTATSQVSGVCERVTALFNCSGLDVFGGN